MEHFNVEIYKNIFKYVDLELTGNVWKYVEINKYKQKQEEIYSGTDTRKWKLDDFRGNIWRWRYIQIELVWK